MDGRDRRVLPASLVGPVAALVFVAVLMLPTVHSAFSATTGNPASSLAADRVLRPSDLTATQRCSTSPVVFRGAAASKSTTTTPLALSPPSQTKGGDVLVAQVVHYGTSTITAPSDWTLIRMDKSASLVTSAIYWKVATEGERAATFSRPSSSNGDMVGGIVAYSGVSHSNPVAVSNKTSGSGQTATTPALDTTATDTVAVHFLAKASGLFPKPEGTTERWRLSSDSEGATAADELIVGPGAIPQRTSTVSGSSSEWIAQTVVLRPAVRQDGAVLSWTASPSSWATGYRLERSAGGTVESTVDLTPISTTSTSTSAMVNGVTYTFRLWAHRGSWVSDHATAQLTPAC